MSTPFRFGVPEFQPAAIVSMLIVGLVIMPETTGDMIAIREIVAKPLTRQRLADGIRADGLDRARRRLQHLPVRRRRRDRPARPVR